MQWIAHFGVGHLNGGHSGRYPWGSGDRPKQDLEKVDRTLNKYKKLSKKEGKEQEKARKKRSARLALSGGVAAQAKTIYEQSNATSSTNKSSNSKTGFEKADSKKSLSSRFNEAKKKYPNLNYTKIYKEMNANMNIDDNDYYKDLEDKWLKKHGF